MNVSENKITRAIGPFTPVFKYIGIIFTWINLIKEDPQNFLTISEKKIGWEVFLLSASFFLIGLGQNTKTKKEAVNGKIYLVFFFLFTIGSAIVVRDNTQLLTSVLIIMLTNLISFISQSGEYGASANDIFVSGRGSVFCFVLVVIYGIPVGLLLKYFNIWENKFILGAAIIGYYMILLSFEIRFLLKSRR